MSVTVKCNPCYGATCTVVSCFFYWERENVVKPVLIGCEESQVVCATMRAAGIEAYSNDLIPTRGNPDWHIQGCVKDAIKSRQWGLIILHPDCTAMSLSGNRWYGRGMPMHQKRLDSIEWTIDLWNLAIERCDKVCLENPTSVIFKHLVGATVQYIQPHQFGHGEVKKTGLALHGLPPLIPTDDVDGREERIWRMPPGPNRKRDRSETFQGIADALTEQFGRLARREELRRQGGKL